MSAAVPWAQWSPKHQPPAGSSLSITSEWLTCVGEKQDRHTNTGTRDAWRHGKRLLYGSKAAELKPLRRKIFSLDLGEAETT